MLASLPYRNLSRSCGDSVPLEIREEKPVEGSKHRSIPVVAARHFLIAELHSAICGVENLVLAFAPI
jgi:hypothetical protein